MREKLARLFAPLLIVLLLLVALVGQFSPAVDVQAAPPAAPTPVANILAADDVFWFRFQPTTVITSDTATTSIDVMKYNSLDVSHTIDQGTVNTTTLTIQYSNDGTNWVNGVALATSNAADATDITRVPVFGRYMRINQDVTNSNSITITLLAVARQ